MKDLPIIALVGRPNVGKSTLYNALTRTRDALVADQPGLTRDRRYGMGKVGAEQTPYIILDTGGLSGDDSNHMDNLIAGQVWKAVEDADLIFFIVDSAFMSPWMVSTPSIGSILCRSTPRTFPPESCFAT